MARFHISVDEYLKWHHVGRKRSWKAYLAWAIALSALATSIFIGQYAFAVLWAALLMFLYFSTARLAPKMQAWQMRTAFALGPFDLVLGTDCYTVRVGGSELKLDLQELGHVHDFGDHYSLNHNSGISLCIPKRALSEDETRLVESYRKQFPGFPERRGLDLFSSKDGITRA